MVASDAESAVNLPLAGLSGLEIILPLLILPLLVSITLGLLQMLLSFIFSPIIGYMLSIVILVVSVYKESPLLIGNYSMMARNKLFMGDGVDLAAGVVLHIFFLPLF